MLKSTPWGFFWLTQSRILSPGEEAQPHEARAHGAEVTDIAVSESASTILIATAGRDRVVQLFNLANDTLELVQTIDNHVGAVNNVLFTDDGQKLLSGSADRTVIVHERVSKTASGDPFLALVPARVITLKASPTSLAFIPGEQDSFMVSTMNHQVFKFDMSTGVQLDSFKATDNESNDVVSLNAIKVRQSVSSDQTRYLVGISSGDKSIRVYGLNQGQLITREFGHSEGVSDVAVFQGKDSTAIKIVTTGLDGTIMIWELSVQSSSALQDIGQGRIRSSEGDGTPIKESVAMKAPLRRVLSRSELAEYMILDPTSGSGNRTRAASPPRLRRQSSKPNIFSAAGRHPQSPSPPPPLPTIPSNSSVGTKPQSSTSSWSRNRSPSPPPQSPKTPNSRANNTRLRRPPSIPANLRSIGRTKSTDDGYRTGTVTPPPPLPLPLAKPIPTTSTTSSTQSPAKVSPNEQFLDLIRAFRDGVNDKISPLSEIDGFDETKLRDIERELTSTAQLIREKLASADSTAGSTTVTSDADGGDGDKAEVVSSEPRETVMEADKDLSDAVDKLAITSPDELKIQKEES